ncbi:MAG: CD225/dispanin family protein [Armatimonadota bacterium]|nr:CD225/dispanin family protein [Armatimonadota bacterium]
MPLGIAGIINAVKVENQAAMGDFAGAHASASRAKQFAVWGAVGMAVVYALIFGFAIFMAIFSSSKTMQYEPTPPEPYLETRSILQEQIIGGGTDI